SIGLQLTTGVLTNAAGATISSIPGAASPGARTIQAPLDNQGTVTIAQTLTLNGASATYSNSGTISLTTGDLTISAGSPSTFTNTGTMTLGSGRTFTMSSGVFNRGGSITGGTLSLSGMTLNLNVDFNTASTS